MRQIPNPNSVLLTRAIVGGVGLTPPPKLDIPAGMAAIVLFVPRDEILEKNMIQVQADLGLPWHFHGGEPVWLDELAARKKPDGP